MRPLAFGLAAVLALVGCVQPAAVDQASTGGAGAAGSVRDPWGGFPEHLVVGHDHADPAAHAPTPTMEELAHLALPGLAIGEADLLGEDHLVVASVVGGFSIVDVKDRAAPRLVSFTPDPGYVADVKASASGHFVFVAIQLAGFTGIHAWNVQVKERPVLVGAWPMAGGCHMIAVHEQRLFCAPNDATVRIFDVVESAPAVAIVPRGAYAPKGSPPPAVLALPGGDENTHDMTVQDDPLTGEPVMFVSFWDGGVHVVDVKDPSNPRELGRWAGEGADDSWGGAIHTTMAGLVEGRRVVATVPEYAPVPSVTFLDATDYAHMTVLGVWAPKSDFGDEPPSRFSTHNFQLVGGRLYLAMYHGGVVVLDASTLDAVTAPHALGYLVPFAEAGRPMGGPGGSVWDVVLRDGHAYATGTGSGLHVLHHTGDALGDASLTSFA